MQSSGVPRSRFLITPTAFTMIELIMVMVIVVIMGVLVMYPISYLSQIREQAAANKVKADIRYAQSYALTSQQETCVSFNPTGGTYSLYYQSSGTWVLMTDPLTHSNFTVNISSGDYSGVVLSQTNFNGSNNWLIFDTTGKPGYSSCSCAGGMALSAQGSVSFGGGTTVTVEPNTGMVQLGASSGGGHPSPSPC